MDTFNNKTKVVKDDLTKKIQSGSKVSIAAACFSIYAYQALKDELESCDEFRFIFTSPTFVAEKTQKERREFYIPRLNREKSLYGTEFEVRLRNELKQKAVAKECADWMRRKASFRTNTTREGMNNFLVVENPEDSYTYMPMNSFTAVDLGCERGNNISNMVTRLENPASKEFLSLFENVWNDKEKLTDVTNDVIEMISTVYQENSPELIYFMTLYNIFNEFLDDISEDVLPNEATGFKNSVIWNKLYNFQKDAALGIINKLEQYNGCILADSVGLGKTFTALAVIKYYEGRNKNVLVLCPKKLSENWMTYRGNLVNNPLVKDRFRYDVLYHTDLSRNSGMTPIGLPIDRINWGNYDLVVIDEYEIIGLNLKSQLNQGFRGLVLFLLTLKIADKAIHRRQYAQNRNLSAERGAASLCSASTRHTLPTYISFRRSTELSARVDLHRLPLRHSTHVPVARAA